MEDDIECSCTRACLCQYTDADFIKNSCLRADFIFEKLELVIKLQADLKQGIEPTLPDGKTFQEKFKTVDYYRYRATCIAEAFEMILHLEKCTGANDIIKGTDYEKIYFASKQKYSKAIEKLSKLGEEDVELLEQDPHHEIDF